MKVDVRLYRDGVTVRLTAEYRPKLYGDYMVQANEMAMPFFMLGYHMLHARLIGDDDG